MRYMGSKARHAKDIIPFLMEGHDQNKPYVEPFVGGGNIFSKVPAKIKWGNDTAEYAVALLEAVSKGYTPPEILSKQTYYKIKESPASYPKELVGFSAYCCSYGGKFWGGYARNKASEGDWSTCPGQQVRNLEKQKSGLVGAKFTSMNYLDMDIEEGSTVYCDPPYANTTGYKGGFDHKVFWDWCDSLVEKNCRVFVSEYVAPNHWGCVWQKEVNNTLVKDTGSKKGTERLFTRTAL